MVPPDAEVVPALALSVPATARVNQGNTASLPIAIVRQSIDADVAIEVTGLPAGVTADALTIGAGRTDGRLVLTASGAAAIAPALPLTITATAGALSATGAVSLSIVGISGELDSSFGDAGAGVVVRNLPVPSSSALDCALGAGGTTLVAVTSSTPDLRVQRYLPSGQPDLTFDGDGEVLVTSSASAVLNLGPTVVERADGSVLIAYRDGTAKVRGFSSEGAPLPGFGQVDATLTLDANAERVALLEDAAGAVFAFVGLATSTKMYKLTAGGGFDPGFGVAGEVTLDGIRVSDAESIAQGRFVVSGGLGNARVVARLTAAGALDNSFGTLGRTVLSDSQADFFDVEPLTGGRVAATAALSTGELHVFGATGSLDASFSADGRLSLASTYLWSTEHDGSLFVVGASQTSFDVYRLSLTDGALVTSFGAGGIAEANISPTDTAAFAACLDGQGRLTMVGGGADLGGADFAIALARMWL